MRPIILGMNPNSHGYRPLDPDLGSGRKLMEMIGEEVFNKFDRTNVLDRTIWSRNAARKRGYDIISSMKDKTVMVLGNEAWIILGLPKIKQFTLINWHEATWWRIPHPSGRNRIFNLEENRTKVRQIFMEVSRAKVDV